MRIEIEQAARTAARFWAGFLRQKDVPYEIGAETGGRPLFNMLRMLTPTPTREQVTAFEEEVYQRTLAMLRHEDIVWDFDDPQRGGYMRTLSVDNSPCKLLDDAGEACGLRVFSMLPHKTIVWMNPDSIKVKLGYGGKVETLPVDQLPARLYVWDERRDGYSTIPALSRKIGGFVAVVPTNDGRFLAVDEDANHWGLPYNREASKLIQGSVFGNVVLFDKLVDDSGGLGDG